MGACRENGRQIGNYDLAFKDLASGIGVAAG